jgi:hypothetical protein
MKKGFSFKSDNFHLNRIATASSPAFEKRGFRRCKDSWVIEFVVDLTRRAKIQNPVDPVAEPGDG